MIFILETFFSVKIFVWQLKKIGNLWRLYFSKSLLSAVFIQVPKVDVFKIRIFPSFTPFHSHQQNKMMWFNLFIFGFVFLA